MAELGIGIVGTGKIAKMHAAAIAMAEGVALAGVSSRRRAAAEDFAAKHGGTPVEGTEELLALPSVEAVYIATPTAAKEKIALAAIAAGRHVLVEKPLASYVSATRLADAAKEAGVAILDATHFTHNPRTEAIRGAIPRGVGRLLTLHSNFHADVGGKENIRFDPALEPAGALGDLGWYSLRAVVEFLEPEGPLASVAAEGSWDDGALVAASALLAFESGERASIDCGFLAGAFCQDLTLVGTEGILGLDDFVHDWEKGRIAMARPEIPAGFTLRKGRYVRGDENYVATPSEKSHVLLLLEAFARVAQDPKGGEAEAARTRMTDTQKLVDAVFEAAKRGR